MEATKKVGGPEPSVPQSYPLTGSQQQGGGLRESRGPQINSGSLYFQEELLVSTEAIIDGACGPDSQAHTPGPILQLLQDPAQDGSPCVQASQDALRLGSANPCSNPVIQVKQHFVMGDEALTLPMCTGNDSTSDPAQYGPSLSRLQVRIGREGKAPAKVLVGWGKGPRNTDQMAPLGPRKSRWLSYYLSRESSAVKSLGSLLASAQTPVPDQAQGQHPCPAQDPALSTSSALSLDPSTPTPATTPALCVTPTPPAVEPYTSTLDHLPDTTAVTKGLSQDLPLRNHGNQQFTLLEPSKMVISCQDKVNFHPKENPPISAPAPESFPGHAKEHKVTTRQVSPKQTEDTAEKPLVSTSRPGTPTPGPEPKTQGGSQICSSQPDKQPPDAYNNSSSKEPPSTYQLTCRKQSPPHFPKEVMQIPSPGPPAGQDAVEDHVLVFDMATGNTRMGLMCHDPMGSRAVLVGLMPSHPATCVPENILSTQPLTKPILSPDSNHSSFWSTTAMLSSPVPSSLSSGSYREVALVPKEARLNLEARNSPSTDTPIRVGRLTRPVPLQFGERMLTDGPDLSWSKPDAENNELSHTIWMLESSRMPSTPTTQTKKLQWMMPDPALSTDTQVVPSSLLQKDIGCHKQKEDIAAPPNNPQAEDAGQAPINGQTFLKGQNFLAGKLPVAEEGPLTCQPPSTKMPSLTCLQTSLARQVSLAGHIPLTTKSPITKEPTLLGGLLTSGESGHTPTQGSEPLGLPAHVGILRVPLAPEEACACGTRDKIGMCSTQSFSIVQLQSWPPGSTFKAQEEQLSLIPFTTPGTGCKVLPLAMVGPGAQSMHQFKLTAEDITRSPVVTHPGLLRGACYQLVSGMDTPQAQPPVLCRHSSGPYQAMAAIVIDTGTGFTKCGLAGEDHILSVVPSRVQILQHPAQGQPRYAVPENQEGSYPVLNRGVVSDWDALEVLWQHLFYCRLRVQPEELAVLVADSPISPRTNREKVAEILFEHFHVPAMQTVHQALLALYAYGRTTGLVLGSGHGTSYVAPILTGDLAPLDIYRLDVAGADLTDSLTQLLLAGGHSQPKPEVVNQIKEACCYVAMDMEAEKACAQSHVQVDYMLPDKQVITLGSERFSCPEALFQPNLLGLNQPGLPQLALLSISRLEAKQQEQLLANVVLEGGNTLIRGFPERLRQDLGPGAAVLGSPHRAVAAWLGGSIMASRDSFQNLWLSRHEYEEEGPWAIYKYQL